MRIRRRVLFLGGPFSGLLTAIASVRPDLRVLPWICLVPLLISLGRQAERPLLRVGHGLTFGLVLCVTELSWVYPAMRAHFASNGGDGQLFGIVAAVGVWTTYCGFWCVFSLASGPLLRRSSITSQVLLVPLLWSGLEVARGALDSPWLSNWLALGTLLPPPTAESQAAALGGVHLLSFALVASQAALAGLLREPLWRRQVAWALLACLMPAACFLYGRGDWEPDPDEEPLSAVLVSHAGSELDTLSELTVGLASTLPDCVLWPTLPVDYDESRHTLEVPFRVRELAEKLACPIFGGTPAALEPHIPLVIDGSGQRLPSLPDQAERMSSTPSTLQIFELGASHAGFGLGFDFHGTGTARTLVRNGAAVLLGSLGERRGWPAWMLEREARLLSFRAVENRRWLAASAAAWGAVFGPDGAARFRILGGVEGAGTEMLRAADMQSAYTQWGWWFEPAALLAAFWITLSAAWRRASSTRPGVEPR